MSARSDLAIALLSGPKFAHELSALIGASVHVVQSRASELRRVGALYSRIVPPNWPATKNKVAIYWLTPAGRAYAQSVVDWHALLGDDHDKVAR